MFYLPIYIKPAEKCVVGLSFFMSSVSSPMHTIAQPQILTSFCSLYHIFILCFVKEGSFDLSKWDIYKEMCQEHKFSDSKRSGNFKIRRSFLSQNWSLENIPGNSWREKIHTYMWMNSIPSAATQTFVTVLKHFLCLFAIPNYSLSQSWPWLFLDPDW